MDKFIAWFEMVEQEALKAAQKTLPWKVQDFSRDPDPSPPHLTETRSPDTLHTLST